MGGKIKKISLGFKINIIILFTCLIFALVFGFVLYFTGQKIVKQKYDDSKTLLSVVFEQSREEIANEIFAEQDIALEESLKEILKVEGVSGVCVYNKNGELLSSAGTEFIKKLSIPGMEELDKKTVFLEKTAYAKNIASYSSVIKVIDEELGYITVYYDFTKINKQLNQVLTAFIFFYIGTIFSISLILYLSLSRFIIKPILILKKAMKELDNKSFGVKVDFPAHDEIGEIGTVFNKMSETLLSNDIALKNAVQTEAEYALKLKNANKELKRLNVELAKSNNSLEILNFNLENTVKDRTAALLESNTSLQKEIDEKEKMKNELIRVEKLESIGLLAGGIAHDFNNILSVIIGNLSLAQVHAEEQGKIAQLLIETEKSCFRARDLTKQLLTFSKGGAPVTKIMKINELIQETVIFALRGSNVRHEFSIDSDLSSVKVDEGQLNQVINNIVINASHAMPDGGVVKIKAKNIEIEPENTFNTPLNPGQYIQISISDQGDGIAEKDLQTIFDPYFTTKQNGSGLGLATSHSIIEKHKGFITAVSEKSKGATFFIYLPAFLAETDESIEKTNQTTASLEGEIVKGKGRVLVMDDEELIRDFFYDMLTFLGYESDFAEDGVSACEKYKEAMLNNEKFNAVVMDLTIPGGMGGKDAIKEILKIDPEAKVIVSSGYSNDPVMSDFKSYGFSGVVSKPFKINELSAILHKIM